MPAEIFVARQPIFDEQLRVTAYELHHRSGRLAGVASTDPDTTSLQMLDHTILGIGLDPLIGRRVGLLMIPASALLNDQITALPAGRIVLHLPAPGADQPALTDACGTARRAGFKLAIAEGTTPISPALLSQASYVSVDFRRIVAGDAATTVARLRSQGCELFAKHLGSHADFHAARTAGFSYFQGPFFAEPELFTGRELPASCHALTRLMTEIHRPDLDLETIEELIRRDVALSVKLLRYLQSAGLGWRHEDDAAGR